MGLYVIVEGKCTEPKVYRIWLPELIQTIQRVERLEDLDKGRYFLVAGYGYPSYNKRIKDAIADIRGNQNLVSHLLICVDSEDLSVEERRAQICDLLASENCPIPSRVVVADCCIESWLLGHRKFVRRTPHLPDLVEYLRFYNVIERDPERMPRKDPFTTRARFHFEYLRRVFAEREKSYSKDHPGIAATKDYLQQLIERSEEVSDEGERHLASFAYLLGLSSWYLGPSPQPTEDSPQGPVASPPNLQEGG